MIKYQLIQVVDGKEYSGNFYGSRQEAEKEKKAAFAADRQTGEYRTTYKVVVHETIK